MSNTKYDITKMRRCKIDPENGVDVEAMAEEFFPDGYLMRPDFNGHSHDIIGYHNGRLVEWKWMDGSDRLCAAVISLPENTEREGDREAVMDFLREGNGEPTEGAYTEVWGSGKYIIADFYHKSDCED